MITIHKEISQDVFKDSSWPLFNEERGMQLLGHLPKIGLISFMAAQDSYPQGKHLIMQACIDQAQSLLFNNPLLTNYTVWLFMADLAWKPKNRITLYKL